MTSKTATATTPTTAREALAEKALFLFLVLGLPLGLAGASKTFDDGDVSWHVASGRWILAITQCRRPTPSRSLPPVIRG